MEWYTHFIIHGSPSPPSLFIMRLRLPGSFCVHMKEANSPALQSGYITTFAWVKATFE